MNAEEMAAGQDPSTAPAAKDAADQGAELSQAAAGVTVSPEEVAALRKELGQLRDQNLRLIAEARNLQQRAWREKAEALRFAEAEFARELLVVVDDLERTLAAASTADAAPVVEGVRLIHEQFLKILRNRGIVPIEAVGKPFDPDRHQAVLQQASTDYPAGVVLGEVARGYMMHERVLRPSRVIVSTGPAAQQEQAAGPQKSSEE
jgi:molecular chaperone GrpE